MNKAVKVGFVLALVLLLFMGCDKDKSYPATPELEFLRIEDLPGDSLSYIMRFQDGDGDIGSNVDGGDITIECVDKDVLYHYYEMEEGTWGQVVLTPPGGYCVRTMTPTGQDKTLEGEMIVNLPREFFMGQDASPNSDSIRLGFQLRDRAGNISSEVFSPLVVND